MTPLFRPEALEGQRQQWLGEVRLVQPLRLSACAALVCAAAAALAAWLVWGEYTRRLPLAGAVVAGQPARADFLAPAELLGLLREGQAVQLHAASRGGARPLPQAGRIVAIGGSPAGVPGAVPMYRVSVELLQPPAPGTPWVDGLPLQAQVMLERRRLIQWLFEPPA